jgi:hypothetical protein
VIAPVQRGADADDHRAFELGADTVYRQLANQRVPFFIPQAPSTIGEGS